MLNDAGGLYAWEQRIDTFDANGARVRRVDTFGNGDARTRDFASPHCAAVDRAIAPGCERKGP